MTRPPALLDPPQHPQQQRVACLRCEYDLRGLPRDANCPECGTPVEPSWRRAEIEQSGEPPPLHLSSATWLRAVGWGCVAILATVLLQGAGAVRIVSGADAGALRILSVAVGLSSLALMFVGVWLLGAREPLRPAGRSAGAGGSRASRYAVRAVAVLALLLPFAMIPLMNRMALMNVYKYFVIVFAALGGVSAWVALRRLAAAARRSQWRRTARLATALAWLATPLWLAHGAIDSSILVGDHHYWSLSPHPVTGYVESAIVIPCVIVKLARWEASQWPWVVEALMSIAIVAVLAATARIFFAAARQSPARASGADG